MQTDRKPNRSKWSEECAVFGVSLTVDEAAGITYNGLLSLQHRGQEGAGIAVVNNRNIVCRKDVGLVSEVFSGGVPCVNDATLANARSAEVTGKEPESSLRASDIQGARWMPGLPDGRVAVGHTRYSTTGNSKKENTGPFVTEYLTGRIATAHNGNITNAQEIREELKGYGIHFNATSDSEVISSLIAYHITTGKSALSGVARAADLLRGAFSLIIATSKDKLIAVRDPNGFRPLCIGKSSIGGAIASESCALDTCGFEFVRDVQPGEIIMIENGEITHQGIKLTKKEENRGLCIFEYVYFARPDSVIDGLSVYGARYNMGLVLAQEYPVEADVVCGVPDSGLDAAYGYSAKSSLPLVTGFVKSRYIGRSFIYPTQSQRDNAVRLKLNPLSANIRGKRIVLVDDSIVRGTTSEKIVKSLKNAGAKEVHMRISSPPFRHSCHYGTDIDSEENLIANRMSLDEICRKIGADSLGYISIEGLKAACSQCALPFCTACFSGNDEVRARKNVFETHA